MLFICKDLFSAVLPKIQTTIFIIIYSDGKHKKQYECEFCGRTLVALQAVLQHHVRDSQIILLSPITALLQDNTTSC